MYEEGFARLERAMTSGFRTLADLLGETNGRLASMDHRLENVEGRLESMDHRLENVEGRLESMDHRLENVEAGLAETNARLASLEGRFDNLLATASAEQRRLRDDVTALAVRVGTLERKVS